VVFATLSLWFADVLDFNGERILASIHGSCEKLGMLVDLGHAVPDGLVLGTSTVKSSDVYLESDHQDERIRPKSSDGGQGSSRNLSDKELQANEK
jgi:hypothetical protein